MDNNLDGSNSQPVPVLPALDSKTLTNKKPSNPILIGLIVVIVVSIFAIRDIVTVFKSGSQVPSPPPNVIPSNRPIVTSQISPNDITSSPNPTPQPFFIHFLDTKIPETAYQPIKGNPASGQPEDVVPQINGKDKNIIKLAEPFSLNYYEFSSASSFSFVVDVMKNNQRQALYTHINNNISEKAISQDEKNLYLVNNLKKTDGSWQLLRRIINVETNQTVTLPNLDCFNYSDGFWSGNTLITHSDPDYLNKKPLSSVCLWNLQGKLLSRFEADLDWGAASKYYLISQIGILPKNEKYVYLYTHSQNQCIFYLQDYNAQSAAKRFIVKKQVDDPHCDQPDQIEFSLIDFTPDSQSLKFHIKDINGQWEPWQYSQYN